MSSGNVSEDEKISGILKKMVDFQNGKIDSAEELIRKIKEYMNIKKVQTFLKHFLMYLNDEGFYKGKRPTNFETSTEEQKTEEQPEENNLTITDFRTEIYDKNIENIKNIITVARIPRKGFTNLITSENREKNYVVDDPIEPTNLIRVNNALRTDSSVAPNIKEELVLKPVFDDSGNFVALDGQPFLDGSNNIINDPSNPHILQMVIGMKNTILNDEVMAKEVIDLNKGETPILLKWVKTKGDIPPFKGDVDPSVTIRESNIDGDGNITNVGETNIQLSEERIKNTDFYEPVAIAAENIGYLLEGPKEDVADGEDIEDVIYDKTPRTSYGLEKIDQLFDQMKKLAMKGGSSNAINAINLQKGNMRRTGDKRIERGKGIERATIHSPDFVDIIINNALKYMYF
jgi:hypothetical protein